MRGLQGVVEGVCSYGLCHEANRLFVCINYQSISETKVKILGLQFNIFRYLDILSPLEYISPNRLCACINYQSISETKVKMLGLSFNIFRYLGDFSHLFSFVVLFYRLWKAKSCAGKIMPAIPLSSLSLIVHTYPILGHIECPGDPCPLSIP